MAFVLDSGGALDESLASIVDAEEAMLVNPGPTKDEKQMNDQQQTTRQHE